MTQNYRYIISQLDNWQIYTSNPLDMCRIRFYITGTSNKCLEQFSTQTVDLFLFNDGNHWTLFLLRWTIKRRVPELDSTGSHPTSGRWGWAWCNSLRGCGTTQRPLITLWVGFTNTTFEIALHETKQKILRLNFIPIGSRGRQTSHIPTMQCRGGQACIANHDPPHCPALNRRQRKENKRENHLSSSFRPKPLWQLDPMSRSKRLHQ